jgi:iron complex outermembrane receptor protein
MLKHHFCVGATMATSLIAMSAAQAQRSEEPIEHIIITESPLERSSDELTVPVTILTRDEIATSAANSLGELLGNEPGITQSSFAPGASRPIIRGLDNFRVRVQENGIASHDASALSEDHGVPTDPLAARRIEVVLGPATLRYGNEAIGGVVNVLNDRLPSQMTDRPIEAETVLGYNSASDGAEGSILLDGSFEGGFAWHFDASARKTSDYDIPSTPGTQSRTSTESQGVAVGGSWIMPSGHIGVSSSQFFSEYKVPAAEHPILIDMQQSRVAIGGSFEGVTQFWTKVDFDLGYSDYTHDEIDEEDNEIGSTYNIDEWEGRAEFLHAPLGDFEGAIGFHIRGRDLSASGEGGELIAPAQSNAQAAFFFEEIDLGAGSTTIQLGARVERVEVDGTGLSVPSPAGVETYYSRNFTPIGGSIGLLFDLSQEWTASITGQVVQRAPDALELFSKGPHEATETFELGNAYLDTETARSIEMALKHRSDSFSFDVTGFYTAYEDFIYKAFTGVLCGEEIYSCGIETELTQIVFSADDATFYGAEIEGAWETPFVETGTLTLSAQFDFVRGELDNGGKVPRMPPMRYGAGFAYERDALTFEANVLRASKQDDLATFETMTKGYTLVDAAIGWRLPLSNTNSDVTLRLSGHNLLDEDIRNHVSFKKDDVLLPGRSLRFHIVTTF